MTPSWRVLGWEAVVRGCPWRQGQGCFPRRLTTHFLAIVLLQAHLMAVGTSSHMGMGQGHIPVTEPPARLSLLGQPICARGLVLLLLLRPHITSSILVWLIIACRILPWEAGVGLWVSGPEDEPIADLSGWGLQAHGLQRTRGMPTAGMGAHTRLVWVPTRLPCLHCRWVPGFAAGWPPAPTWGFCIPGASCSLEECPPWGCPPRTSFIAVLNCRLVGGPSLSRAPPGGMPEKERNWGRQLCARELGNLRSCRLTRSAGDQFHVSFGDFNVLAGFKGSLIPLAQAEHAEWAKHQEVHQKQATSASCVLPSC